MLQTNINLEAAGASKTNGIHTDTSGELFCTDEALQQAHDSKATAALTAQLGLAGHAVHRSQDGGYLVSKYGLSRYCQDFAELQAFAVKLGVNHE